VSFKEVVIIDGKRGYELLWPGCVREIKRKETIVLRKETEDGKRCINTRKMGL